MAKPAFERCSGDYARFRPRYPAAVIDLVNREAPAGMIADIGAGTGIFSRSLAAAGRKVIAVDPSPNMLAETAGGAGAEPIARACATAERTALASSAFAAVTCAQSFHWFNPPLALAEFARVMAPGGLLLLVWNNRDTSDPFVAAFEALVSRFNPNYVCEYRAQDWVSKIDASGRFGPVTHVSFRAPWRLTADAFIGFTRSASYIRNVLSAAARTQFEVQVRGLISQWYGPSEFALPLNAVGWWCRRA